MAKPIKIKFRFAPLSDGGHSLMKLVVFDFSGNSIPLPQRYSFNGRYSPESQKPMMYETVKKVREGVWDDHKMALDWCKKLYDNLDKSQISHGFICDSNYPSVGTRIWESFKTTMPKPEPEAFIFKLRIKLASGKYVEFQTSGIIDEDTAEVKDDYKTCLGDIAGQWFAYAARNPQIIQGANAGLVFGDGKNKYTSTKDFSLCRMTFNPQTGVFISKKSNKKVEYLDPKKVAIAQDVEVFMSNL